MLTVWRFPGLAARRNLQSDRELVWCGVFAVQVIGGISNDSTSSGPGMRLTIRLSPCESGALSRGAWPVTVRTDAPARPEHELFLAARSPDHCQGPSHLHDASPRLVGTATGANENDAPLSFMRSNECVTSSGRPGTARTSHRLTSNKPEPAAETILPPSPPA